MTVGQLLRKARQRLKKSQAEIAKELDISQPRVTQLEAGDSVPSERIYDVARVYQVDPLDLIKKPSKKSKGAA